MVSLVFDNSFYAPTIYAYNVLKGTLERELAFGP